MKRYLPLIAAALPVSIFAAEPAQPNATAFLAPPQHVGRPKTEHATTNRAFQGIPSLAVAPKGRLWADWYSGAIPGEDHNNYVVVSTSGDGGATWAEVLAIDPEWVLPASTWRETDERARMIVSMDHGKTWSLCGGCNVPKAVRAFDEHMFIERKNRELWLLVRTKYGIGESISTDRGKTWPGFKPSAIAHTSSRFFITRLASGNLLLVKHGVIAEKTGRSHLTAYVSTDDGKTWSSGLLLDERNGVSYPDGQQTPEGLIRIIYDFSRTSSRHILMAAFREEDVVSGKDVSGTVRLRQLVSEASGGQEKPSAENLPVEANAEGEALRTQKPGRLRGEGIQAAPLIGGAVLSTDRKYTAAELPAKLPGAEFLRMALDGTKTLTCNRAGMVRMLTPTSERNGDSQTKALLDQGLKKVALPEVRLFAPTAARNFCTLYQKDCAAGESVTIGKWAAPVLLP